MELYLLEVLVTIYAFDSSVRAAYLDTERAFLNATSLCLSVCGQENIPCALVLVPPKAADAQFWSVQTTLRSAKIFMVGLSPLKRKFRAFSSDCNP